MSRVVLKAGTPVSATSGAYRFDLRDLSREAGAILEAARDQARRLLEEAALQAATERQAALAAARQEGLEQGRAEGQAQALSQAREQFARDQATLTRALSELLSSFREKREKLYAEARRDVVVLALEITRRLVRGLLLDDDTAVQSADAACREALEYIGSATEVVLRLHPDDAASLTRLVDEYATQGKEARHVRIVEDADVGRGGAIVETADCRIDASINTQLERLADALATDWRTRRQRLLPET